MYACLERNLLYQVSSMHAVWHKQLPVLVAIVRYEAMHIWVAICDSASETLQAAHSNGCHTLYR